MLPRSWLAILAAPLALAQAAADSGEPSAWLPQWELTLRAERTSGLTYDGEPQGEIRRVDGQVRLRWEVDWQGVEWQGGFRSAAGSDGNANNLSRWDQQPSNGTRLDTASARTEGGTERAFGSLQAGFQELGLITTQAVWDRDLRFLGAAASLGLRSGPVQEAGLRFAAGRVRVLLPRDDVDLRALQAVLKAEGGDFAGTLHLDGWHLAWDAAAGRLEPIAYGGSGRQRMDLDGLGGSAAWAGPLPLSAAWSGYRNRDTRETSEELRIVAGNRVRPFRPQVAYTWQRLSATGETYPLGSAQWWYYRAARGPRVDVDLPLRRLWTVEFTWLRQTSAFSPKPAERAAFTLARRFQ